MRDIWRGIRRFSADPMSVLGLVLVVFVVGGAALAPYLVPYPTHSTGFIDFAGANMPPDAAHWLGTDTVGRDVLSRIVYGYRVSLLLGGVVLVLAAPLGTLVGLLAGYSTGWLRPVLMRVTDVFLALPSLVLAMAILGVFPPSQFLAMVAVAIVWWPWYARLVYSLVVSLRSEGFVLAAELVGASRWRIMWGEILPNCLPAILTKASLDMGLVILLGASLSFIGLGAPPPTPDLGTMVAEGAAYLPDLWWLSTMAGVAILIAVLGFSLLADGLRDLFGLEG